MKENFDDVIIVLKNTIDSFVRENEAWKATRLLDSEEIVNVLDSIDRIECEDFMLPYVNDLLFQVQEDKIRRFLNIEKYGRDLDEYEDYTIICQRLMLGESNTVLAEIYNELVGWRNDLIDNMLVPSLPLYKHLIINKNLPF